MKAIIVAAMLATASSAGALTISYSQDVTTATRPDWNSVLSLRQFDPTLGTLTGIALEVRGSVLGYQFVENRQNFAKTVYFSNQAYVALSAPGTTAITATPLWSAGGRQVTAFDGTLDFAGSSTGFGSGFGSDTSGGNAMLLADYIGTGFVNGIRLDVTAFQQQGVEIVPFLAFDTYDEVTGGATITYSYDAFAPPPPVGGVPEPASWAMLIAGFGLVGAAQRRRNAAVVAA